MWLQTNAQHGTRVVGDKKVLDGNLALLRRQWLQHCV